MLVIRMPKIVVVVLAAVLFALVVVLAVWLADRASGRPSAGLTRTCLASNLHVQPRMYGIGMSGAGVRYMLKNTGSSPCTLAGPPRFSLGGRYAPPMSSLNITQAHPSGMGHRITLPPGGKASFSAHLGYCFTAGGVSAPSQPTATQVWTFRGMKPGISVPGPGGTISAQCYRMYLSVGPVTLGTARKLNGPRALSAPRSG